MRASLAFAVAFGALWSSYALSLDDPTKRKTCEAGHALAHETPPGGYSFARESWMRPYNNAFAYYACVENDSSARDLFVYWHIPGIKGVISYLDSITKPRIFPDHPTVTVNGCLIYGNNRDVIKADFLGHKDEASFAQSEGDCHELRPQPRSTRLTSDGLPSFEVEGRLIFPTNIKDIENTLIRFVYSVGLRETESQYTIKLSYAASPVDPEKFKGSLRELRIRPSDKSLISVWQEKGFDSPLSEKERTFEIALPETRNMEMVQQEFQIMDLSGIVIDEIPAPFLSEISK